MDKLRVPFFVIAAVLLALAVLIELAASGPLAKIGADALRNKETPGLAINYLALLDALVLYNLIWMGLGLLVPRAVTGRAQGIVTLVLSFFALIGTVALIFAAFGLLMLMISLLLAVPFGTIAYFAAWGHFAVRAAAATLGLAMLLKLLFCLFLVLAHQGFLKNKGLIVLIAVSLGLTWVTAFVQALLPNFLVSIGDALVALIVGVVSAIWLLLLLITSIVATVKAILSLRKVA
jgi:hypothetical protein